MKELNQVNHPNLVKLLNVIPQIDKIYLIFEYCNGDLGNLISDWRNNPTNSILGPNVVKKFLF